ncbi:MAG: hypothetical protein Q8P41_29390 [Pseudomonadota bacterium]|nr:hypothetical protein [Pseudomonadota bacterium]
MPLPIQRSASRSVSPLRRGGVLLLPLIVGCSEYQAIRQGGIDIFEQSPVEKIDVLMVVDDSSSMESYQYQLGSNFQAFISWFVEGNVDYQIAVTTTDDGNDSSVSDPARGAFVGPIIRSDMDLATAEELFRVEVNVGTNGSGIETGLKTAHLALTDTERLGDQITEFLRDDASLSIVFVSDEEDSSPWPVNDYINAFFELKGHRDRDAFNASALTVTDESLCSDALAEYSSPGTRYVDAASQTHGLTGNLCDSDFSQIVTDLSLANSRITDIYALSREPDAETLTVTLEVDGVETDLPCDSGEWNYQRITVFGIDTPGIVFDREHLPPPGSILSIRYLYGDGSLGAFCGSAS